MTSRGRLALGVLLTVLVAAAGAVGLRSATEPDAHDGDRRSRPVIVERGSLTRSLVVSGELVAVGAARIAVPRFRERGAVPIQAMAPDGADVAPGDLLLQVDNANLSASLSADVLSLDKAENDLARKASEEEARVKELEVEHARLLLEKEKAALKAEIPADLMPLREWQDHQFLHARATQEFERTRRALAVARDAAAEDLAHLRVARDQIRSRIEAAERDVESLRVVATAAGTVVYEHAPLTWNSGDRARKFQVGDQVSPGMVVMTVADLADLEARIYVSEVDGGLVTPGLTARITTESAPGVPVTGTLTAIRAVAERQRRLSNVRVFVGTVALDRTDRRVMKPGMSVRVELALDEHRGLVVPRGAVHFEGDRFYVRRVGGAQQEVTVVARSAESCIVEGLAEGDAIERGR